MGIDDNCFINPDPNRLRAAAQDRYEKHHANLERHKKELAAKNAAQNQSVTKAYQDIKQTLNEFGSGLWGDAPETAVQAFADLADGLKDMKVHSVGGHFAAKAELTDLENKVEKARQDMLALGINDSGVRSGEIKINKDAPQRRTRPVVSGGRKVMHAGDHH